MKLFLRLGVVVATAFLLLLGLLVSGWLIPVGGQLVYASDQAPPPSVVSLQQQSAITFTPVATAFLPLIINGAATADPAPPGPASMKITHIEYNPIGDDGAGEYVELHNIGGAVADLTNWTLRDAKDTIYTFPAFTLDGGAKVKIWNKNGGDTTTDLYWGRNSAIWNNSGDTATLRDSSGSDIDICIYPGSSGEPGSTDCQ